MVIVPEYNGLAAASENQPTGRITRNWETQMQWERDRQSRLAAQSQAAIEAKFQDLLNAASGGSKMDWLLNTAIPELVRRTEILAGAVQMCMGPLESADETASALTGASLVPSDAGA